eukprot:349687-Chlamydomonas_euryale.AAC.4
MPRDGGLVNLASHPKRARLALAPKSPSPHAHKHARVASAATATASQHAHPPPPSAPPYGAVAAAATAAAHTHPPMPPPRVTRPHLVVVDLQGDGLGGCDVHRTVDGPALSRGAVPRSGTRPRCHKSRAGCCFWCNSRTQRVGRQHHGHCRQRAAAAAPPARHSAKALPAKAADARMNRGGSAWDGEGGRACWAPRGVKRAVSSARAAAAAAARSQPRILWLVFQGDAEAQGAKRRGARSREGRWVSRQGGGGMRSRASRLRFEPGACGAVHPPVGVGNGREAVEGRGGCASV